MEKCIKEFVTSRCQKVLIENADYMKKEKSGVIGSDELQIMAEELCYKKVIAML